MPLDLRGAEPADPAPLPLDALCRSELEAIYDDCVRELGERQREVVLLREYGHASWSEIAAELDAPSIAAAQELYRRATIRLAEGLRRRVRP